MRMRVLAVGFVLGLAGALIAVVTASAASINVSSSTVPVGGSVTVSGNVLAPGGQPGCVLPGTVTLISGAFAGQGSFQNSDVETTADSSGNFSVVATILPGVTPGTYTITGRCGGGNLGVEATLTVTPALPSTGALGQSPATGAPSAPFGPIGAGAVAAATLVALALWARRRRAA
jgi:hypothetical protein